MKKLLLLCLSAALLVTTCKKSHEIPFDDGCINFAKPKYIGGADSAAATALFKANSIDYSTLRYIRVILNDTIKTGTNPGIHAHIFAIKFYNGLPDLTGNIGYHFFNGVFQSVSPTPVASVNLPTSQHLTLPQVRQAFDSAALANNAVFNTPNPCLSAQFGYFNLNAGTSYSTPNYVAAWYVTPANSTYPEAIIIDSDASVRYFITGIFTLIN